MGSHVIILASGEHSGRQHIMHNLCWGEVSPLGMENKEHSMGKRGIINLPKSSTFGTRNVVVT